MYHQQQQQQQKRQQRQQRNSRQGSQVQQNRQQLYQQNQYQEQNYPPLAPPAPPPPPPAGGNGISNLYPQQNNNARPNEIILQISSIPVNPMISQQMSLIYEKSDIENKQTKQKEKKKYPSRADGKKYPTMVSCPSCRSNVTTVVEEEIGKAAWVWCLIIFMLFPMLCCIPFCMSNCKDKTHYCPQCETPVGRCEKEIC